MGFILEPLRHNNPWVMKLCRLDSSSQPSAERHPANEDLSAGAPVSGKIGARKFSFFLEERKSIAK
jgi:hypothetical protein